jgi:hypothetical protein
MTDEALGNQDLDTSVETEQAQAVPRTYTDEEVNGIKARAKREAYEKARRDEAERYQQMIAAAQQQQQAPQAQPQQQEQMGGMSGPSEDEIRRLIDEQAERKYQEQMGMKIAGELQAKIADGIAKYPDFEEKVGDLNLQHSPALLNWMNSLDNTADIMYDMADHPSKYAYIRVLAHESPQAAQRELRKLSESIKQNEAAQKMPTANDPLSQPNPSISSSGNGEMTADDFRKMDWLKA